MCSAVVDYLAKKIQDTPEIKKQLADNFPPRTKLDIEI
jgi:hypothetical protein